MVWEPVVENRDEPFNLEKWQEFFKRLMQELYNINSRLESIIDNWEQDEGENE